MSMRIRFSPLLTLALLTLACAAERDEAGEIIEGGSVGAFDVQIGDCYDDPILGADEVTEVSAKPCDEPHDNEVFALFDVPLTEYPGDEAITALADEGCLERFEAFVGAPYEESVIAVTHMTPSENSWRDVDDREVVCVVYHMDLEKLTGTVRNTGM